MLNRKKDQEGSHYLAPAFSAWPQLLTGGCFVYSEPSLERSHADLYPFVSQIAHKGFIVAIQVPMPLVHERHRARRRHRRRRQQAIRFEAWRPVLHLSASYRAMFQRRNYVNLIHVFDQP